MHLNPPVLIIFLVIVSSYLVDLCIIVVCLYFSWDDRSHLRVLNLFLLVTILCFCFCIFILSRVGTVGFRGFFVLGGLGGMVVLDMWGVEAWIIWMCCYGGFVFGVGLVVFTVVFRSNSISLLCATTHRTPKYSNINQNP